MRVGRYVLLGGAIVWVLAQVAPTASAQATPDTRFGPLADFVRAELARTGAPGVALAVVDGDRVVFAEGFGLANTDTRAPVTPDTLFQIGSVTKSFTAAAILAGAGRPGALTPDTAVGTVVGGLTPCLQRVTVGQLLTHTGGLIDEPAEFGTQGEEALAAYARSWAAEYCLIAPGRAFSYSNSGYALAGLALQEQTRTPFADVMRTRVLAPLGMTRTTFRPTEAMTFPVAVGHRVKGDRAEVVRPLANDTRLWPAGTLYSSAADLARFLRALANDGRLDGKQALPAAAVNALMTPRAPMTTQSSQYGYGFEIDTFRGQARVGHGGTMTGYTAQIQVLPERHLGVALVTNGDGIVLTSVAERALELALGTAAAPQAPAAAPPIITLTADQLPSYLGTFTNPRRFTVEVRQQEGGLVLHRFGRDFPMRPVARDRFLVDLPRGGTETIAFGFGPDGRADYLQMAVWALAKRK
jgi:CubicO group peptidase (beta-lactamase class C family)